MEPYKDFAPTPFDHKGYCLPDRQDWLVGPVSRTRDSDALAESNWHAALASLGGEGPDVEVHRFGHWGPGWFEIILIRPDSAAAVIGADIESALSDYPVLDDDDFTAREHEAAYEHWTYLSMRERIKMCAEAGISIYAARAGSGRHEDEPIPDLVYDRIRDLIV